MHSKSTRRRADTSDKMGRTMTKRIAKRKTGRASRASAVRKPVAKTTKTGNSRMKATRPAKPLGLLIPFFYPTAQ